MGYEETNETGGEILSRDVAARVPGRGAEDICSGPLHYGEHNMRKRLGRERSITRSMTIPLWSAVTVGA